MATNAPDYPFCPASWRGGGIQTPWQLLTGLGLKETLQVIGLAPEYHVLGYPI